MKRPKMMKRIIVLSILATVIIVTGIVAVAVASKERLIIKPYYNYGELEEMLKDDAKFTVNMFNGNALDDLSPIEADRFMFYVSQDKGIIINKSYQPHTLSQFNDLFVIECMRQVCDNKIAVIYKLKLEENFVFAIVMFDGFQTDYSNSTIDPGVYNLWSYSGECYFYSEVFGFLSNGEARQEMLFQEFEKMIPDIELVFSPFYNVDSNMWNWSTLILTETGVKQIVFGLERTNDSIERSAINYSKLIGVAAIDCNWMEVKEQ